MVPGTFVDQSTITVVTPPRKNKNDTAHVSVTNDGATFTSLPGVRKGGAGSYLEFNFVGHAPWGPWDLGVDQTSTSGVTPVLISRTGGKLVDGATEGSDFYASDDLFCAHGVSASRTFSKFTEVEYVTGSKIDTEPDKDSLLTVAPTVGDAYDTHVQRDATYEIEASEPGRADGKQLCCRFRPVLAELRPVLAGDSFALHRPLYSLSEPALAEPRPVPHKAPQQP